MKKTLLTLIALVIILGAGYYFLRPQVTEAPVIPVDQEETMMVEETMDEEEMEEVGYVDISPEDAYNLIQDDAELIVIDVSPVYADGHLPGAINYPVGDGSLDAAVPMLDSEATYLVYCHSDSASMLGAQTLIDAGFMNVYRLEGNYAAWVEADLPIEVAE